MFVHIESGAVASIGDIRAAWPETSISDSPGSEALVALGYARVEPTEPPEGDVVTELAPAQGEDGVWRQAWEVREFTAAERAEQDRQARAALVAELSRVHDDYSTGTTRHRGVPIAIDVEARINARGVLDAVRSGQQPVPFAWFAGGQSLTISSEAEMQALHDAIFAALQRGYTAKAKVLASIGGIENPAEYDAAVAFRAHL